MKKELIILILLLSNVLFLGCSKENEQVDNYYYLDEMSKENFESIKSDVKVANSTDFVSTIKYIYEIQTRSYPLDKDYKLELPFYIPEDTDKVLAFRINAPFTHKKSIDGFTSRLIIDYRNLQVNKETGNREFIIEIISDNGIVNDVYEKISINSMYSATTDYGDYLNVDIKPELISLAN